MDKKSGYLILAVWLAPILVSMEMDRWWVTCVTGIISLLMGIFLLIYPRTRNARGLAIIMVIVGLFPTGVCNYGVWIHGPVEIVWFPSRRGDSKSTWGPVPTSGSKVLESNARFRPDTQQQLGSLTEHETFCASDCSGGAPSCDLQPPHYAVLLAPSLWRGNGIPGKARAGAAALVSETRIPSPGPCEASAHGVFFGQPS